MVRCPACDFSTIELVEPRTRCSCGWTAEVERFAPLPPPVHEAEAALPDDAVCTAHPAKRAIGVCAGSGDYLCALCSVEIEGQTYSAGYLEHGGREKFQQAFDRQLPRPDRMAATLLAFCFPFWLISPALVAGAMYYYVKLIQGRRRDPLLRQVTSRMTVVWAGVLLAGIIIAWVTLTIGWLITGRFGLNT